MSGFALGKIIGSPGVRRELTKDQIVELLRRHIVAKQRENASEQTDPGGSQIFSAFKAVGRSGVTLWIWILTEPDQSRTFVMFPHESAYRASDLVEAPDPLLHEPL